MPETEVVEQSMDHEADDRVRAALQSGYGRIADVAGWIAAVHRDEGRTPLRAPVAVILAADHGIATADVEPAGTPTGERLAAMRRAEGPVAALAARTGIRLRIEDVAVDTAATSATKIRRGTGRIDREDAMTAEETHAALALGRDLADQEADSGTDMLLVGAFGAGSTVAVAALAGVLTGSEPITVAGRDHGDPGRWMRRTAAVRDAMRRGTPYRHDPIRVLQRIGGADLACAAGLLAQAGARRTPVVIDGALAAVSALLASYLAPGSPTWWAAATTADQPAHAHALAALGITPMLDFGMSAGDGAGALIALEVIRAALDLTQ